MFVPVKHWTGTILMPTTPSRARRWIKSKKATPYWDHGVFCVRLNEPCKKNVQPIAVGIDPGSKKEAFTVKSQAHTYLNIQADAVTWVKEKMEVRRTLRQKRRGRKTPYRISRNNRKCGGLAPSTKARWQWKLRVAKWLSRLYPISTFVVEDIKARSKKGKAGWNVAFSPLQEGKVWFYGVLRDIAPVSTRQGWETKELRDSIGLVKSKNKLSDDFSAHCVDSWVLANWFVGGHTKPDNQHIVYLTPYLQYRRELHYINPSKGGIRRPFGGTKRCSLKKGSYVKHPKFGICYVGGYAKDRVSLHLMSNGKRAHSAKVETCKFLTYASWRAR